MAKSGAATLPLHSGSAPGWLFKRMEKLGGAISEAVIQEYGREELLERLSDPYWFQAFGCVLGFDWHSSGLTTTTMGALKESLSLEEHGVTVAGGKGKKSRETPQEIEESSISTSKIEELKKVSRLSASIDNSCIQDSHSLYHHTLVFTEDGDWSVVQQGMNSSHARRYHWNSPEHLVEEPHEAICAPERLENVLNLSSKNSEETRQVSLDLVNDGPEHLTRYLTGQSSLKDFPNLEMPDHHWLRRSDLTERSIKQLNAAYEVQPQNFKELLQVDGVGKKSLRALALISELVHGSKPEWDDPAKYSYAHGGKDGTPYPVNRQRYDKSIEMVRKAVEAAEINDRETEKVLKRLHNFTG